MWKNCFKMFFAASAILLSFIDASTADTDEQSGSNNSSISQQPSLTEEHKKAASPVDTREQWEIDAEKSINQRDRIKELRKGDYWRGTGRNRLWM